MNANFPSFLRPLLSNLAKGGIGAILAICVWAYTSWRGQNRLDYQYQLEKSERREDRHIATIEAQQSYIAQLEASKDFLEALYDESPLAQWGKSVGGAYFLHNPVFDDRYVISNGLSPDSVLFRTDLDIWPDKELAASYRRVDQEVMRTRRIMSQKEYAIVGGKRSAEYTWKYPVIKNNILLGTAGVSVPVDVVCQ